MNNKQLCLMSWFQDRWQLRGWGRCGGVWRRGILFEDTLSCPRRAPGSLARETEAAPVPSNTPALTATAPPVGGAVGPAAARSAPHCSVQGKARAHKKPPGALSVWEPSECFPTNRITSRMEREAGAGEVATRSEKTGLCLV